MSARSVLLLASLLLAACGATARRPGGSSDGGESGAAGASESGGAGVGGAGACAPPAAALVRLSFPEQVASMRELLGDELGDSLESAAGLTSQSVTFPSLAAPSEGTLVHDAHFALSDELAQRAGRFVRDRFADVTGCDLDYDCVRGFVASFAEQAFRRPLSEAELEALLLPVERAEALGVPAPYAAEYGVYAVFESPHFLYRSEFGPDEAGAGTASLGDYELASAVSFFVTGGPPDRPLLDAAAAGTLATEPGLEAQLDRLFGEDRARQNLQRNLSNFLRFDDLPEVVIDVASYPLWSSTLQRAMAVELDALLAGVLAGGPASALLTTRSARVNRDLAEIYGLSFPGPGTAPDELGFVELELPETRAGLLTRAGWLTLTSLPDGPQLLRRGSMIRRLLDCHPSPDLYAEHPRDLHPQSGTQGARARARLSDDACSGCHQQLDPFGLALDEFDAIGELRTTDSDGDPIDARAQLPELAGGAAVRGGAELSQAIPPEIFASGLTRCVFEASLSWPGRAEPTDECWQAKLAAPADASIEDIMKLALRSRVFSASAR